MNNQFPDIYMDGMKDNNPYIFSPNAPYAIFFYQTRETLMVLCLIYDIF